MLTLLPVAAAPARNLLETLGHALGLAWLGYGFGLMVVTLFAINLAVFAGAVALAVRFPEHPVLRTVIFPFELFYLLANPLAYLLILVRTSSDAEAFVDARASWLDPLGWAALVVLWTLRLVPLDDERRRQAARIAVPLGLAVVVGYATKDFGLLWATEPAPINNTSPILAALYPWSIFALYMIPMATLVRFWVAARSSERWRRPHGFVVLPRWPSRVVTIAVAGVAALTLPTLLWRPSAESTEARVLGHRDAILEAASATGTDPRLLAALIFVLHREQISPFGVALERSLTEAWLVDAKGHGGLSDSLDLSIGLAQIKPSTAQLAILLTEPDPASSATHFKEYRSVWRPPAGSIDRAALADLHLDARWFPDKRAVVDGLLDDGRALVMAALILELYARQWEQANPGWSIRTRPEILASLYQLGFERSHPKPNPQSTGFGEAVRQAMHRFEGISEGPVR